MFYYHLVQFKATHGLYSRLRLVWIAQNSKLCLCLLWIWIENLILWWGYFFQFFLPLKDAFDAVFLSQTNIPLSKGGIWLKFFWPNPKYQLFPRI